MKKEQIIEMKKQLQDKMHAKHVMATPQIKKIVINMGVKDSLADKKNIDRSREALVQIAGQLPKTTKAKKSIASFKLREGDPVGLMVTLRGKRMYDFYDKLVTIVLPRIRDFHGVPRESFDGHGNYTLGFPEHTVFPEIDPGKTDRIQGLEISIITTAATNEEGFALLEAMQMPFQKTK